MTFGFGGGKPLYNEMQLYRKVNNEEKHSRKRFGNPGGGQKNHEQESVRKKKYYQGSKGQGLELQEKDKKGER